VDTARALVAGVIEGFYGPPWTWDERRDLIEALSEWGGDWYVWAPKSAPTHRDDWRAPFTAAEIAGFASLAGRGVALSVGLTPGADATPGDVVHKLSPVVDHVDGFTLCFDDLDDLGSSARHAAIANEVLERLERPVWLVPTHYAGVVGSTYLDTIADEIRSDIPIMWTGPTVVTDAITTDDARRRARALRGRPPLLWDNTPVNDAMMRDLLHLGPYSGRDSGLRSEIAGVLVNPMEFAIASRPTIRSAMAWARGRDHLAEWRDEVDRLGLRILAEATSFAGDRHWPGDEPTHEWWTAVRDLADPADSRLSTWTEAARQGARAALALLDIEGRTNEPAKVLAVLGAIGAWRQWNRTEVSTLGRGPRLRPVFSQDESGRFRFESAAVANGVSLVDRIALRVLGQ